MSEPGVRFYDGWTVAPQHEVTEAAAKARRYYARAVLSESGAPRVTEMYSDGTLSRVEFSGTVDTIPGVPFAVRRPAAGAGEFHWSVLRLYTADGALRSVLVQLLDDLERSLMSVEYSPAGALIETSKATFGPSGGVHHVFTYDETGELFEVYDSPLGRSPSVEDALDEVADRAFYADGRALPAGVPSTPGNSPDEIVRRELGRPEPVSTGRHDLGFSA